MFAEKDETQCRQNMKYGPEKYDIVQDVIRYRAEKTVIMLQKNVNYCAEKCELLCRKM